MYCFNVAETPTTFNQAVMMIKITLLIRSTKSYCDSDQNIKSTQDL
jgi:hypothetical protein